MALATDINVPNVGGRVTTLGTELSGSARPLPHRRRRSTSHDVAAARLVGTVWEKSDLAVFVYRASVGLGRGLARLGVSANTITYVSLAFAAVSCVAAALGAFAWASAAVIASGLCDALDGVVARSTGTVSRFGALLDSTIDRVTDALPLLGLVLYFGSSPLLALIPAFAMLGSFVIPYTRARAEGLGISLPSLFMRRPERIVLLVLCLLLGKLPIAAPVAALVLLLGLAVLAVLNTWGAVLVLRAARTALTELEETTRSVSSKPAATGRA